MSAKDYLSTEGYIIKKGYYVDWGRNLYSNPFRYLVETITYVDNLLRRGGGLFPNVDIVIKNFLDEDVIVRRWHKGILKKSIYNTDYIIKGLGYYSEWEAVKEK